MTPVEWIAIGFAAGFVFAIAFTIGVTLWADRYW